MHGFELGLAGIGGIFALDACFIGLLLLRARRNDSRQREERMAACAAYVRDNYGGRI